MTYQEETPGAEPGQDIISLGWLGNTSVSPGRAGEGGLGEGGLGSSAQHAPPLPPRSRHVVDNGWIDGWMNGIYYFFHTFTPLGVKSNSCSN